MATAHYVLIDAYSGFVWEEADATDPIEACRIVDEKVGGEARSYEREHLHGQNGYYVYEAPADWTPVEDGQSPAACRPGRFQDDLTRPPGPRKRRRAEGVEADPSGARRARWNGEPNWDRLRKRGAVPSA